MWVVHALFAQQATWPEDELMTQWQGRLPGLVLERGLYSLPSTKLLEGWATCTTATCPTKPHESSPPNQKNPLWTYHGNTTGEAN